MGGRYLLRQGRAFFVTTTLLSVAALLTAVGVAPHLVWRSVLAVRAAYGVWAFWVFLAAYAACIAVHEASHALAAVTAGLRVRFGVKFLAAYVLIVDPVPRRTMFAVLLAPQVGVLTVLLPQWAWVPGGAGLAILLWPVLVAGSVGDFLAVAVLLRSRAAVIRDSTDGLQVVEDAAVADLP